MRILQIGAPKSGNFWLYKIVEGILIRSDQYKPNFIEQQPIYQLAKTWELNYPEQAQIDMIDITDLQTSYRISSIFRMPIDSMEDYVSKTGHVWTHSPICKASNEVFRYFDKKIYIIRDPRDRAISSANYHCSPYMLQYFPQPIKDPEDYLNIHFDRLIIDWVWHVFDHLKYSREMDFLLLYYESFLFDFQRELSRLLNYLEVELPVTDQQDLEREMSFSSMKKQNPNHLKRGVFGYWRTQLALEQRDKAKMIAGPLLDRLKYDDLENTGKFNPPHSFGDEIEDLRQELLVAQQTL